jgi:hypothetical protein
MNDEALDPTMVVPAAPAGGESFERQGHARVDGARRFGLDDAHRTAFPGHDEIDFEALLIAEEINFPAATGS